MNTSWQDAAIRELRQKLPIQNPLYAFVHNNMLLNVEEVPFDEALNNAYGLYSVWRGACLLPFAYFEERGIPIQRRIQDFVIPLISAYLDQGSAVISNPWRKEGWLCFLKDYVQMSFAVQHRFIPGLRQILKQNPSISDLMDRIGVPQSLRKEFLVELGFYLKGWSGMIRLLEDSPELAPWDAAAITLEDWLHSMLMVLVAAFETYQHKINGGPPNLAKYFEELKTTLAPVPKNYLKNEQDIQAEWIPKLEKNFQARTCSIVNPVAQVLCCIDDREESFRRHLEAIHPGVETFGVVGFFGVDMYFHLKDSLKPTYQCPPVVVPQHHVYEEFDNEDRNTLLARFGQFWRRARYMGFYQTRTAVRSAITSFIFGGLSIFPLITRVAFPRLSHKVDKTIASLFGSSRPKRVDLKSYSFQQQAQIVQFILGDSGVLKRLAKVVVLMSHGSSNQNNPFRQAYGCGACSGNSGLPNALAFAQMANHPEVRQILSSQGYLIPDDVVFVAAFHDTCADEVHWQLPTDSKWWAATHLKVVTDLKISVEKACEKNAFERCQKFEDFHHRNNPDACREHVKVRSMDIAQPRPEYGHAGVAFCVLGRRNLTEFFDFQRRSFLVSYDPTQDEDGQKLVRVAAGAIPVCANISLDYFYSAVDNQVFGAGTKLPLNITSLLGVMTGSKSDLRVGLGLQMIERHTPSRIIVLVECYQHQWDRMLKEQPRIARLYKNKWMHMSRIDPDTGRIQ